MNTSIIPPRKILQTDIHIFYDGKVKYNGSMRLVTFKNRTYNDTHSELGA